MIGTTLGHYGIVEQIGAGGMGVVYRAHDERLDRDVAIKVLPEEVASDPDRLRRFEQEAKAVAKLDHPNILAIHDFGTSSGVTYVVMELLKGVSLREVISGSDSPPARRWSTRGRLPMGSPRLTTRGSSTATSNRRMSSSPKTVASRSSISASPSSSFPRRISRPRPRQPRSTPRPGG